MLPHTDGGPRIFFKPVENVEVLYMMRPKKHTTDDEPAHLYALDPSWYRDWEAGKPEKYFVKPSRYRFLDLEFRLAIKRCARRSTELYAQWRRSGVTWHDFYE